ncbi:hypothetical protein Forpe1208_v014075 [Fusarium oxysporum f. sp. rapae]|uniref:Transposase Tc1-like domain-containing protein n=1 Tax=Fusarium oxysporum f. sp. rapae TaxID=485398 RepID=A0A8J5NT98_FUSOX|nr:hypothetical protein Forpe1208_v014075 [Fusarium oxysporum f. sp. rapae]
MLQKSGNAAPPTCNPHDKSELVQFLQTSTTSTKHVAKNGILSIICAKRERNHEFSEVARALIVQAVESGRSYRDVGEEAGCSAGTIFKIFQRWKTHQTLDKKCRSGRPRKLTVQQIRYHYGRKWRAMQRIPPSKETARQRFLWCQAWKEDIKELLETIFSDESSV